MLSHFKIIARTQWLEDNRASLHAGTNSDCSTSRCRGETTQANTDTIRTLNAAVCMFGSGWCHFRPLSLGLCHTEWLLSKSIWTCKHTVCEAEEALKLKCPWKLIPCPSGSTHTHTHTRTHTHTHTHTAVYCMMIIWDTMGSTVHKNCQ